MSEHEIRKHGQDIRQKQFEMVMCGKLSGKPLHFGNMSKLSHISCDIEDWLDSKLLFGQLPEGRDAHGYDPQLIRNQNVKRRV